MNASADRADGPRDTTASPASGSAAALDFGDPLGEQSSDDTDRGWGETPRGGNDGAADLARFLDEKPPHHI